MKQIGLLVCFLLICDSIFAQSVIYKDVVKISKQEFDKHLPGGSLICESIRVKTGHRVVINTHKRTIVLKDEGEMKQYEYGCDMTRPPVTLIHELEPNTEEWYFINRQTATIDTMVGKPVFYPHTHLIVCLEGSGTDVKQRIQIGQLNNGRFKTISWFRLKGEVHPGYVYWFNKHTLFLNDNNEKFYKLIF
jgi:hypothetical protein